MLEQEPAIAQIVDQGFVGILKEHIANERNRALEVTIGSNRINHWQAVHLGRRQVVGAEGRGQVNQTRAVFGGDVVGQDDVVRVRNLH
ncbi:unannotated protein [freshwater metagenome]|uniref:Unannotated protein n=1 Tax=freshwater metagenome TaxID=449393 RepID=A0A6J6W9M1_9ZZZZ